MVPAVEVTDRFLARKIKKPHPTLGTMPYLKRIFGVNVLAIYGLSDVGALEILAETGTDLSKWSTEKHFVSWLNLCPNNKISGGKLISSKLMKKLPNPQAKPFVPRLMACRKVTTGWAVISGAKKPKADKSTPSWRPPTSWRRSIIKWYGIKRSFNLSTFCNIRRSTDLLKFSTWKRA